MYIKNIKIEGFRNYSKENIFFSDNTNVITGENAQGKTNLLEALYYLSQGRSFRTRSDKDVIGFNRDLAFIDADVHSGGRDNSISISMGRGRKKRIAVNKVNLSTAAELSGKFTVVLFCPDDLNIIRDGPTARRRLLDNAISQLRPQYALAVSEFSRLYDHKTRILKDHYEKPSLLNTLEDFNTRLARVGAEIIRYRGAYVKKLAKSASEIHADFSGNKEDLNIEYKTVKTVTDTAAPAGEIFEMLMTQQQQLYRAEIDSGTCLSGVHKDDLDIEINGKPARSFASQGQTRTAALSLKLAERDICFKDTGECPVLLLDDVLSELDSSRQSYVLNRISSGQVFITCCEDMDIAEKTGGKVFKVENGRIT